LDYGEFVTLSVHLRKIGNDEHLHKAFAYFDRNESGYIEIDELRESLAEDLGQNHEEVINAIIRDVDTDKVCILLSPSTSCKSILVISQFDFKSIGVSICIISSVIHRI